MAKFEMTWTAIVETLDGSRLKKFGAPAEPIDVATGAAVEATPILKRTLRLMPGIKSAQVPPPRIREAARAID